VTVATTDTPKDGRPRVLRTAADLVARGVVPQEREREIARVAGRYAVSITPALARLIDPSDPADPIARQFVPDVRELDRRPEELVDPIGDDLKSPVKGLVHRYPDRALLKLVSTCAVYCRFCFRRETVGPGRAQGLTAAEVEAALAYIRAHPRIWEIVLTGGDPLALSARRIAETTSALGDIAHVKVLRWHTRIPIADPTRIDDALIAALTGVLGKSVYVALHANHPRELTAEAREACRRLIDAGVMMISQSVLLKGVNDDVETLEQLMRAFVETRVKPYYLHHGDLAPGTAHFRTTLRRGQTLMRELRARLSGLAMPTYMLDIPGAHGKAPVGPQYVVSMDEGDYQVADNRGDLHRYRDSCSFTT
jgi:lysine 2,3-aminomutase